MVNITNNDNVKFWTESSQYIIDRYTDQGDFYRQHVLNPMLFTLLGIVKDKTILDAGCGEGYLSRLLAKKGAKVTGVEAAKGLIDYAVEKEEKEKLGIKYIHADLSKWIGGKNYFDIAVSNMVFMDIPDYKAAIKNCMRVLKQNGIFIFSLSHPCFEQGERVDKGTLFSHKHNHAEDWQGQPYVKVEEYFQEYTIKNYIGYSIHRTLSTYINFLIENGCSIQKIIEPQLPEKIAKQYNHHERDFHVPSFILIKAEKS